MSTTRTTPRSAYQDGRDYSDRPSTCTCGRTFANLGELFGHDCPDDLRHAGRTIPNVDLTAADSVDTPEWRGGAQLAGTTREAPATEAQLRFIRKLADEKGIVVELDGLRKRSASRLIDTLKQASGPGVTAEQAAAPARSGCRPNRYAADCHRCGRHVPAEAGELCKTDGRWLVSCLPECAPVEQVDAGPAHQAPQVPAGHYAIPSTGDNDLVFYRVDRPTEGTYAGRVFVKMIIGGHPDQNVRRSAVAGILERIAADPDAAARYGQELGRCCRCNRHLTDETSRRAGIGPECATKS